MSNGQDNSWFSDRTKTIMVSVIMTVLLVGMAWGYYAANQWKQERELELERERIDQILFLDQTERMERIIKE